MSTRQIDIRMASRSHNRLPEACLLEGKYKLLTEYKSCHIRHSMTSEIYYIVVTVSENVKLDLFSKNLIKFTNTKLLMYLA